MGRGGNITLFYFRGIRVAVDYSWFVVLFLIVVFMSSFYREVLGPDGSQTVAYLLAALSALGFFGSILLHEMGHAWAALRNNIGISEITLWMFGGMAQLRKGSDTPGTEFKIAAAGPAVTLLITLVLAGIAIVATGSPSAAWDAVSNFDSDTGSGLLTLAVWLAGVNLLVLGFNLIPAFPLDGGRILLAIAWRITGSRTKATRLSATSGQVFSWLCIGLGLLIIFTGESFFFLPADVITGIWLVLIGFILGSAARGAHQNARLTKNIDSMVVSDVMDDDPIAIRQTATVDEALDSYFLRYQSPWFPVIDDAGRFTGLVERNAAEHVPAINRTATLVASVYNADPQGSLQVSPSTRLDSLLGHDALVRLGALAVVEPDGTLAGVITIQQLSNAIRPTVPG